LLSPSTQVPMRAPRGFKRPRSLEKMLTSIYVWRLNFLRQHIPINTGNLSLESFVTWQRMFNLEEVSVNMSPTDGAQETYTVLLTTCASGDVKLPMIVFDGTTQLIEPIYEVAGSLEAYNDGHWNNGLLHSASQSTPANAPTLLLHAARLQGCVDNLRQVLKALWTNR